jgi:PAS domain S-box-containing protein
MKIYSLRQLLAIRSAWIALIPFLLSAVLGWFWLWPEIVADTENHQRQLAAIVASRTAEYLLVASQEVNGVAAMLSRNLVNEDIRQEYLDTILGVAANLTSLTVTDSRGRIAAIALPPNKSAQQGEMPGIDLSLTDGVRQVRRSGKPAWSDVYLSPVSGGLAVAFAAPAGRGVALGEMSLDRLSAFLHSVVSEEKHSIFVLDRRGQVIADQDGRYTARQYNLTNLEIVRDGLSGATPVTRTFSLHGTKVVGCLMRAPLLDLNILVASPVAQAYRSALTTGRIFTTSLVLALLLAAGLSLLISRSLATWLERLVAHARRIESGDEAGAWPKVPVREFNELGAALQSMASGLREREQRLNGQLIFLQQLLDSIPIPVYYKDTAGRYLGCNGAFARFLGRDRADIVGKTVYDVSPPDRADRHYAADRALLGHAGVQVYEMHGRYNDGGDHDVMFTKATFVDAGNRVAGIVGALIDLTERKRAEEALRESEEKFRVLAETAPTAIVVFQGEDLVYVNPSAVGLFGYSEAELLAMKFWEWVHPESWAMVRERGLARQHGEVISGQYEVKFVKKNGKEGWLIVSAGRIEYGGKPGGVATFVDITEAKLAEEALKGALAEKIVLLKEVHHRVKNNMQVISSLLDLQADFLPDETSRTFLRESQNRIRAMALVHELLYQSETFTSISMGEYLGNLAQYLLSSYGVAPGRISLSCEVSDFTLDLERAIPCGLIMNEMLSNALKHAFPDGRNGSIVVRVSSTAGWVTLTVADTGVGLPTGLDVTTTGTLGLQLVHLLAKQLAGRFAVEPGTPGTVARVTFPESAS